MKRKRATKSIAKEAIPEYRNDGLISRMYRLSGGCNTEHRCKECRYCVMNEDISNAHKCILHGSNRIWKPNWTSCRYYEDKAKPRKKRASVREEKNGQLAFNLT